MVRFAAVAAVIVVWCLPAFSQNDSPLVVNLCDVEASPSTYNHKRIQVQGTISHEFEDFSIHANCPRPKNTVWLMYGGDAPDGVIIAAMVQAVSLGCVLKELKSRCTETNRSSD